MVRTAEGLGINTVAQLTAMDQPIGTHIGNALEVVGSIRVLQGGGSPDTRRTRRSSGAALLCMTGVCKTEAEARSKMEPCSPTVQPSNASGPCVFNRALNQRRRRPWLTILNGCWAWPSSRPASLQRKTVRGRLRRHATGALARQHGAGRFALEDVIDPLVGAVIAAPVGEAIKRNDPLLTFHHTRPLEENDLRVLKSMVTFLPRPPSPTGV